LFLKIISAIGIDDMFLILAAWRLTDRETAVIDRMEKTMHRAGVSVTMTSLTDTLSFLIGSMAPLPAVSIFITWVQQGRVQYYSIEDQPNFPE
jgi:hypothetical protein